MVGAQGVGARQQQGDVVGLGHAARVAAPPTCTGPPASASDRASASPSRAMPAFDVPVARLDEAVGVEADQTVLGELDLGGLERHPAEPQRGPGRGLREGHPPVGGHDDGRAGVRPGPSCTVW